MHGMENVKFLTKCWSISSVDSSEQRLKIRRCPSQSFTSSSLL